MFYFAFGDSDEWAHQGAYDDYLEAIRRTDGWLRELWAAIQAIPEYRGKTSLLITSDHGRGDNPAEWRSHNNKVNGAEIESKGGFVEHSWKATERITAYAGVSRDGPRREPASPRSPPGGARRGPTSPAARSRAPRASRR